MPVDALDLTFACGLPVEPNVPLGPYTSLKLGGPADFFVRARSAKELSHCLTAAHQLGVPWLLLGGGSNLLISDRGYRGLAIKVEAPLGQRHRAEVLSETAEAVHLHCQAGVLSAGLARWTAGLGWHGFEWACGIPGTVGGAAAGNAGAYDGDMARTVERVEAWFPDGGRVIEAGELHYGYRTSRFKRAREPAAVLSVDLRLTRGDRATALANIEAFEHQRREKQPTERSCGSVFKNPAPDTAGRLLDVTGLKGTSVGGAQISHRHANFFVNRGQATAVEVLALMRLARERVQDAQGVHLQAEILLVGEWRLEELEGW